MKRSFTILTAAFMLLAFLAIPMGMMGQTRESETITFAELGLENGVQYTDPFGTNINVTFAGGDNDGKYYTTGSGIRTYGGGTITISALGNTVTAISTTFSSTSYAPASAEVWSCTGGSGTGTTGVNASWSGSATEIVMTRPSGSGHWRLQSITVTYTTGGGSTSSIIVNDNSNEPVVVPCVSEGESFLSLVYSNLDIDDVDDFHIQYYNAQGGTINYSWINASIEFDEYSEEYDVVIHPEDNESNNPRTAYFKIWAYDVNENQVYSNLVTIFQAGKPYVTLTPSSVNADANAQDGTFSMSFVNMTEPYNISNFDTFFYETEPEDLESGEEVFCEWISNINYSLENNQITYHIDVNTDEERTIYFRVVFTSNKYGYVYSNLVTINQAAPGVPTADIWVLTELTDLTEDDVFVIVGNNGSNYAMSNDNGTGSAPSTVEVTVTGNEITSTVAANIQWNISGNATNGYTFYPNGSTTTWLYCTNTNNGVRVGTNANKTFVVDHDYLKHTSTSRYVGIYNSQDWRCYTSYTATNIAGQTFAFYKKVSGGVVAPSITANNVNIAYDATSGEIAYTLNHPVTDGSLSVSENVDWISDAVLNTTESKVTFTTTANEVTTAREGIITLTYTYGDNETVTKDVTITQAAAPVIYSTIPTLFAAATSTETSVLVTFNNWVVSGVSSNGKNIFVTDNNGNGFVIYYSTDMSGTFAAGNILSGTAVSCTLKKYNGFAELLNVTATDLTITSGGTVTVADVAMADLAGVNTGALLHYDNLTCVLTTNNAGTTTFYNLTDGTTTIQVYNAIYAFGTLVEGKTYNITGIYQQYNNTKEILPRNAADIEEVTYTLNITGYGNSDGGYYLIASPVTMDPSTNGMTTGDYDLYTFNQAEEDEWRNYKAGAFTNLEPGKGYLYAHKTGGEFTLSGEAYTGDGAITLYKTEGGDFPGWNLVGNPFNTSAQINRDFYILNSTGDELIQSNGLIAPMQGIFVIATTNGETLTFEPVGGEPADPMPEDKKVVLNINSNTSTGSMTIDRAVVRFGEGRTLPKFQLNPDNTKVYFTEGNENFAVVRSANEGEMPVSFKASENGRYTISVNAENIEMEYLHLIDNMTGADVDLLATPSYSFEANTTDYTSRFRLVFSANNGISEQSNETFAFFNGGNWVVNNEGEATLQVIDMTGRMLSSEQINGNYNKSLNLNAGVYVLRLSNGNVVKTQKVVID